jgi:hypothetical protein
MLHVNPRFLDLEEEWPVDGVADAPPIKAQSA